MMATSDRRIDAYISRSQEFARPILKHLRSVVHKAIPNIEETIKWGFPHFMAHGAIVCSMASFTQHCGFVFWKGAQLPDPYKIFGRGEKAMGQLGKIRSVRDLPNAKILSEYLKAAAALNKAATPGPRATKNVRTAPAKPLRTPSDLAKALARNAKARTFWSSFPPSHRKEYINWIMGAKADDTRARRLATSIEWISKGKPQNWRYMKPKKR